MCRIDHERLVNIRMMDISVHFVGQSSGSFYGLPVALKHGDVWLVFENFRLSCKVKKLKTTWAGISKAPPPCYSQKLD